MSAGVLKSLVLGVASVVVVVALFVQQKQIRAARAQNEQLRAQVQEAEQQAVEAAAQLAAAQTNMARGPDPELLRLRGEVARLRGVDAELARARQQISQAKTATAPAPAPSPPPVDEAMVQYNQKLTTTTTGMKQLGLALRILSNDETATDKSILPNGQLNPKITQALSTIENASPIDWGNIELLISDATGLNKADPGTLLARTKPIQTPDGKWVRVYGMADGSATRIVHQTPDEVWDGVSRATTTNP